jgi:hypothetical protein
MTDFAKPRCLAAHADDWLVGQGESGSPDIGLIEMPNRISTCSQAHRLGER